MPVKTKDYPIYTYDEPAVYKDFSGGMNSDPSNEHLLDSELRDCVNMTYLSGALVKRKGAKKLCDISCTDDLINIQGVFLFTYRITYIIIAADGKLYQGIFNEDSTITLNRLQIVRTKTNQGFFFDAEDAFAGIEEKQPDEVEKNTNHEGYIQSFFRNTLTDEQYAKNNRGSYFDINTGAINVGDVFIETRYLYERKFLCIKTFEKEYTYPNELKYWELLNGTGESFTYTENGVEYEISANDTPIATINSLADRRYFKIFKITELEQWKADSPDGTKGDVVFYNGRFYKCTFPHYNRYNTLFDTEFFIELTELGFSNFIEEQYLLFQNYRKVEAATINNKLYIATGTRIVEISLESNELRARPITPYLCNYTELTKIGYNYMSPYPELAVASQKDTVTTSIAAVNVRKMIGGGFVLTPVMNIQIGDDISNYYFRWEKLVNGTWYVIVPFAAQKTYLAAQDGTIQIRKVDYSSLQVDDADQFIYRCTFAKSFELEPTAVDEWSILKSYSKGSYVSNGAHVYQCLRSHTPDNIAYVNDEFNLEAFTKSTDNEGNVTYSDDKVEVWTEIFDLEMLPSMHYEIRENAVWNPFRYYDEGEYIKNLEKNSNNEDVYVIYRCIKSYQVNDYTFPNNEFSITAIKNSDGSIVQLWNKVGEDDGSVGSQVPVYSSVYDFVIAKADGEYFGSATSVLFNNELEINDNFLLIHSCTKVIADGNKLLFYGDRYNSGQWFKTIINNPGYITDRGCLSFKTTKNESVVKVVPFQGNIIIFANADNVGGSIHLVKGNGDDYDDQSGYYSPYQRRTINASISCSNPDSIQVCDNIIVFKYFNRIYYINASDLNNDTVKVTPCNDRLLNNEGEVQIPWDDDDCISEVTRDYYGLMWKEKYEIDQDGELMLVHPGIRVKMFYKMNVQYKDDTYGMPWLRDESSIFNTQHIIYVKGKPLYLYHNVLLSLDENYYKDIAEDIVCKIHCKAVDCNYDSFFKLINNVLVGFHRNQFKNVDINVIIKNEAGHLLLDTKSKRFAANDLGALHVGKKLSDSDPARIGTTIQDNKMFITINKFPCLLVDTTLYVKTDGSFTFSSLTFEYTTIDPPDSNPTDLYKNIIRPKED